MKYYGSYFKNTDLWIVMEYCGAGSVSDIIRLRNKTVGPVLTSIKRILSVCHNTICENLRHICPTNYCVQFVEILHLYTLLTKKSTIMCGEKKSNHCYY